MPLTITLIFSSKMVAILCLTQCPMTHYLNINHSIGFKAFYALIQKHIYIGNLICTIKLYIIYNMTLVYWRKKIVLTMETRWNVLNIIYIDIVCKPMAVQNGMMYACLKEGN
jgi:hypothetical protein